MNTEDFDKTLERIRREQLPFCPDSIAGTVVARIRKVDVANENALGSYFSELLGLALRPQVAVFLMAMTIAVGALTTTVSAQLTAPREAPGDLLGFGMISNPKSLECNHILYCDGLRSAHRHPEL